MQITDDLVVVNADRYFDLASRKVYGGAPPLALPAAGAQKRGGSRAAQEPAKEPEKLAVVAFAGPGEAHALKGAWWGAMLEKCFAKACGSYAALDGGRIKDAIAVFVRGSSAVTIELRDEATLADARSGALFARLRESASLGHLLGASSPSGSDTDVSASGIVQGHAYSILRVEDCDGAQLLQLRNPWGHKEWRGAWSDADKPRWSKRARKMLAYDPDSAGDSDGTFWMTLDDLIANFARLDVCRLFRSVAEGGSWFLYSAAGSWSVADGTAPGTNGPEAYKNPQFAVLPERPCRLCVSLEQLHVGRSRSDNVAIGFQLVDAQGRGRARAPRTEWRSRECGARAKVGAACAGGGR